MPTDSMTAEQLQSALVLLANRADALSVDRNGEAEQSAIGDELMELAARLSGMAAVPAWQPIETAPKGQRVELWIPPNAYRAGFPTHGEWSDDRHNKKPRPFWKYDAAVNLSHARSAQPSHWRPAPEPPHV